MRAPLSWLREYAALPDDITGREVGEALISAGLEVETIETSGSDITGPLVVGRVLSFVDEPQKNGKTIRWCRVDCGPEQNALASEPAAEGEPGSRGIVCGASNFAVGDLVVVALPGAVLPGGFAISARKTYGHISDGMICAEDEIGIGTDHSGIIVLSEDGGALTPGQDAKPVLGLGDEVLDIAVTPDMGYCFSIRGLAREAAIALGVDFTDPVSGETPSQRADGFGVESQTDACPLFVAVTVTDVDPHRPTPRHLVNRLRQAGMRSISLTVDISNYVMLETGQPNHCYDADRLTGRIIVRQATPAEQIVTLDGVTRTLDTSDVVIADESGPIGMAGVMGGELTEITEDTTRVVIEAASFDPSAIARTSRRHRLSSEASRRFERGVNQAAAWSAAHRVADLLVELGGGRIATKPDGEVAETITGEVAVPPSQRIAADLPSRILGTPVDPERVVAILEASGVTVEVDGGDLVCVPPTWRHDLRDPYDYVEEVGCKVGLETIVPELPPAPGGGGLTPLQRARRGVNQALVGAGFLEVIQFPFCSVEDLDRMGVPADDERRSLVRLANPLADTAPYLRTSLLPGLFGAVTRNTSRGLDDLALFEAGSVFVGPVGDAPLPAVTGRPSSAELEAIEAALPKQPRHLACVLAGSWQPADWRGPGQKATWQHALAFADIAAHAVGATITRTAAERAPWHPGRCAELSVDGVVVGYAGELHPSVVKAFGLPARTVACEVDLDLLVANAPGRGEIRPLSSFPVAKEDVALIVDASVPAAAVEAALVEGAGDLLESIALFDVYTGDQIPSGKKSLAFSLRFRAFGRTLTDNEAAAARDAAIAVAVDRFQAEPRIG